MKSYYHNQIWLSSCFIISFGILVIFLFSVENIYLFNRYDFPDDPSYFYETAKINDYKELLSDQRYGYFLVFVKSLILFCNDFYNYLLIRLSNLIVFLVSYIIIAKYLILNDISSSNFKIFNVLYAYNPILYAVILPIWRDILIFLLFIISVVGIHLLNKNKVIKGSFLLLISFLFLWKIYPFGITIVFIAYMLSIVIFVLVDFLKLKAKRNNIKLSFLIFISILIFLFIFYEYVEFIDSFFKYLFIDKGRIYEMNMLDSEQKLVFNPVLQILKFLTAPGLFESFYFEDKLYYSYVQSFLISFGMIFNYVILIIFLPYFFNIKNILKDKYILFLILFALVFSLIYISSTAGSVHIRKKFLFYIFLLLSGILIKNIDKKDYLVQSKKNKYVLARLFLFLILITSNIYSLVLK